MNVVVPGSCIVCNRRLSDPGGDGIVGVWFPFLVAGGPEAQGPADVTVCSM